MINIAVRTCAYRVRNFQTLGIFIYFLKSFRLKRSTQVNTVKYKYIINITKCAVRTCCAYLLRLTQVDTQ